MTGKITVREIIQGENMFDGTNFLDWEMNLQIVLEGEGILYVLDSKIGPEPPRDDQSEWAIWDRHHKDNMTAKSVILASMIPKIRRQNKGLDPCDVMYKLRELHTTNIQAEVYDLQKRLYRSRMSESTSVERHVKDMIADLDRLAELGIIFEAQSSINLILQSLPDSWGSFIMNYNMLKQEKTLGELLFMLKDAEPELSKGKRKEVHTAQSSKRKGKGKNQKKFIPKPSGGVKKKKKKMAKVAKGKKAAGKPRDRSQDACLNCQRLGHWKRDCPLLKGKREVQLVQGGQTSGSAPGTFVIEINMSTSGTKSWIFDTGCGTHICNNLQGLQISRRVVSGEVDLRVGNGSRVTVQAVGTFVLSLPSGHVFTLSDCYFVPSLTRNIISVSCLTRLGFSFVFRNTGCYVYKDDVLYCTADNMNGLYVLNVHSTPSYNITNKRLKVSHCDDETYLWHCRLAHINKTRITTLLKNGYLTGFDLIH
jgi:hypothetical protein